MNLIQNSSGPWSWWNHECSGTAVVDARSLTGSTDPVADPYVFKSRVVVPPSVLADIGPVTFSPYAALDLQRTVNFDGAGQTLLDQALSPASGWVSITNGGAPIRVAEFTYAEAPTLPTAGWADVAEPTRVFSICEDGLTTAIRFPSLDLTLDPTKPLILETVISMPQDPGTLLAGPTYPVKLPVGWWVDLGLFFTGLDAATAYACSEDKCLYDEGIDGGDACWSGGGEASDGNDRDGAGLDHKGTGQPSSGTGFTVNRRSLRNDDRLSRADIPPAAGKGAGACQHVFPRAATKVTCARVIAPPRTGLGPSGDTPHRAAQGTWSGA